MKAQRITSSATQPIYRLTLEPDEMTQSIEEWANKVEPYNFGCMVQHWEKPDTVLLRVYID